MRVRVLDSMMFASKALLAGEVTDLPEDFASEQITKGRAVAAPEPEPEPKPEPEPEAEAKPHPHRRSPRR